MLPKRRSGLLIRIVDDEAVILDRDADNVHRLNITATAIWNLCDGDASSQVIAERVAADFGRSADEVLPDVIDVLERFRVLGLLETE
jgi:Coenzyme PQQ synthesis protein D (PqqD)